jgi:hypothetical protein
MDAECDDGQAHVTLSGRFVDAVDYAAVTRDA